MLHDVANEVVEGRGGCLSSIQRKDMSYTHTHTHTVPSCALRYKQSRGHCTLGSFHAQSSPAASCSSMCDWLGREARYGRWRRGTWEGKRGDRFGCDQALPGCDSTRLSQQLRFFAAADVPPHIKIKRVEFNFPFSLKKINNPMCDFRTESVAEKMLTNWFAFLLHKFLKVGTPSSNAFNVCM